jgi:hypothetical protein
VVLLGGVAETFRLRQEADSLLKILDPAVKFDNKILVMRSAELVLGKLEGVNFSFCVGEGVPMKAEHRKSTLGVLSAVLRSRLSVRTMMPLSLALLRGVLLRSCSIDSQFIYLLRNINE